MHPKRHRISIEFCTQCRWMLRAAWIAQELLTTFEEEIEEVALRPSSGGVFKVSIEGKVVFDRKTLGKFLELKELKQIVRDHIAPQKSLGHSDSKTY